MGAEHDAYSLSTGLPDDFNAKVTDAWFGYNPKYMDGERLVLTLVLEDEDGELNDENNFVLYGTGEGWEPNKPTKGTRVEKSKGKANFNVSSGVGELISAIVRCGALDKWRAHNEAQDVDPMHAAAYIGLEAHWSRVTKEVTFGGTTRTSNRLLPDKVIGFGDAGKGTKKGAGKAKDDNEPKAKGKAAAKGKGKAEEKDDDEEFESAIPKLLLNRIVALAAKHEDQDAFVEAATEQFSDHKSWDEEVFMDEAAQIFALAHAGDED